MGVIQVQGGAALRGSESIFQGKRGSHSGLLKTGGHLVWSSDAGSSGPGPGRDFVLPAAKPFSKP